MTLLSAKGKLLISQLTGQVALLSNIPLFPPFNPQHRGDQCAFGGNKTQSHVCVQLNIGKCTHSHARSAHKKDWLHLSAPPSGVIFNQLIRSLCLPTALCYRKRCQNRVDTSETLSKNHPDTQHTRHSCSSSSWCLACLCLCISNQPWCSVLLWPLIFLFHMWVKIAL